ncbi:beta-CASP ribonuclease aCPSF1 [Candidatus Woesearchaeota archaeon]|nr:beta-CASP ribonuclease aCPSF1 [Candidatus Woesearchaeota archaeon]|tara:strand:+ start:82 stop:1977 length:1896 start_codon:yes stop_codon:yes gene_type:complete
MAEIIKEILKKLPEDKISAAGFEGANIVLYTKDAEFFSTNSGEIRKVVQEFKKRIELRPDPSITMKQEDAEKVIKEDMPEDAGVSSVIFDPERSIVYIEAEKPGIAIGKQGALLRELRAKILWVPVVQRLPPIKSAHIDNIRNVLYQNSDYRRKFLDKVGHRIYDGWVREKKKEWVRVTMLGAGRSVGRSCMLFQTPESNVIMDCGIDVAATESSEAYPMLDAPDFDIGKLDAVIVTHAHVDHSGFVPWLFKMGYRGPVYCTPPTRDVMILLQLDMIKIWKGENKDELYTVEDVKEMVKHSITLNYEEVSDITPDIRLTFYNSGHIIGGSMAHLHVGNGLHNFMYTADLKFGRSLLLEPATSRFPRLETLTIEATYGGKTNTMPTQQDQDELLANIIKTTIKRGGKVLMPVLGVGRSQDVMVMIEKMVQSGELEPIPVYLEGMLWDVTGIHTAYPEYLNRTIRKRIFHKDQNPFLNKIFKRVGSAKERKQIVEETGPCVILATSGMLQGGPSVEYLKALADNPKNTLIFSCYQGEGSLGRRVQGGEREIAFKSGKNQDIVQIKMDVQKLEISDHSDRKQLMNFVFKCNPRPKKVIVQHGEASRCIDLASSIHKQGRIETVAPRILESVRLK